MGTSKESVYDRIHRDSVDFEIQKFLSVFSVGSVAKKIVTQNHLQAPATWPRYELQPLTMVGKVPPSEILD
jgi:hypothetical protein